MSSAHDPAEPGGDRVRVRADVVPVQRIADLESKRVARAQPARLHAAPDDCVPERAGVVGHDHQLDALLARVAGAIDHHLDPVQLAHHERERRRLAETEPLERAGPLDGEESVLVGDVTDVGAAMLAVLDPLEVGLPVRRIHHEEIAAALDPVDDQVVDDPAPLVRQQRVLRTTDLDLVDVVREERLEQLASRRPLDVELAHVRDVEDAAVLAHGPVLRNDSLVLDRHLPAGEGNHPGAERHVALVEGRAKQGLHARRMLMPRHRLGGADQERPCRLRRCDRFPLGRFCRRATYRAGTTELRGCRRELRSRLPRASSCAQPHPLPPAAPRAACAGSARARSRWRSRSLAPRP